MKEEIEGYGCEEVVKAVFKKFSPMGHRDFKHGNGITVEALCLYCMQEIVNGNGQKHIQISMDDEGNGFHTLFYGFCSNKNTINSYDYHDDVDKKKIILLG